MNNRTQIKNRRHVQLSIALSIVGLLLLVSVGCSPVPSEQPTASETKPQSAPTTTVSTDTSEAPATALPTATSEGQIPAGWATHTSQQCEYAISYPAEMQVTNGGAFSWTLDFKRTNPGEGARNFVYVSVIVPEIQSLGVESVYNYDPAEAETLLNMQVGESKSLRENLNVESGFTYQRMPDTPIGGYAAQTYENLQPWEFPEGTKEIRYFLPLNGCTYLIGGYIDTTESNQPGAITEELFNQIVATIQLTP